MGNSLPHHRLSWLFLLGCPSLILIGIAIISPPSHDINNVNAISNGNTTTFAMGVQPSMELKVPSSVELKIKPTADGQFGRTPLEVDVSTNNTAGYKLTMVSDNDTLEQRLTGTDYKINSLSANVTCATESETLCAEFPIGKWGYRVSDATSYAAVSTTTPQVLRETELAADSSKTTVYFGSKLDNTTPTGSYGGVQLTFTATTNIVTYSISYERGNESANDVTGLPDQQTGKLETEMDTLVTLSGQTPTRTNYDFKGWCVNEAPTLNEDTLTDTCNGNTYQPSQQITLNPTESAQIKLYAIWEVKKTAITFNFDSGISKVSATGKFGSNTDTTQDVTTTGGKLNLMAGQDYTITPYYKEGYEKTSDELTVTPNGAGQLTQYNYTPSENTATITVKSQPKTYTIKTVKTATGISNVTLGGQDCSAGCSFTYGSTPALVATVDTGYTFSNWSVDGKGSVTADNASTTFTVGAGDATITPTAVANTYACNKRYRLQNADGTWGSYTSETAEQVAYGSTCSYSKSVADYKNTASGTNNAQASTSGTMNSTNGITLSLDFYRNTFALTVNKDSYISSASASTSAVHGSNYYRWGQSVSITATASSSNKFKNWTQTSGTTSSFGSSTTASTTFTMPKSAATIQANGEANSLQGMTSCPSGTTTSTDSRDGQSYRVATLSDGKCWMLDNLNLGGVSLQVSQLDSSNTNFSGTVAKATFNNWIVSTSSGDTNGYTTPNIIKQTGSDSNGSYNALYNYCAASMNTYCLPSNTSTSSNTNGSRAISGDICPKGWRLPTGGSNGEWQALRNAYSSDSAFITALKLPLSGYFVTDAPGNQGSSGYWWSSSRNNATSMYRLGLSDSTVTPASYNIGRYRGFSVRCVLGSS